MNYQSNNYRRFNQAQSNYNCANNGHFHHQRSPLPEDTVVAMAYIPFQTDITVYDECKALSVGTLFPVLNLPFTGMCGALHG